MATSVTGDIEESAPRIDAMSGWFRATMENAATGFMHHATSNMADQVVARVGTIQLQPYTGISPGATRMEIEEHLVPKKPKRPSRKERLAALEPYVDPRQMELDFSEEKPIGFRWSLDNGVTWEDGGSTHTFTGLSPSTTYQVVQVVRD